MDLFDRLLAQASTMGARYVLPYINGEPLVDPFLWFRMERIANSGFRTWFYTNGGLLNQRFCDRIMSYGNVDLIVVSLNAATPEIHQRVTGLRNFYQIVENARYLIENASCRVMVNFVECQENMTDRDKFWGMFPGHRHVSKFDNWAGSMYDPSAKTGEPKPCVAVARNMYILWDGRVTVCCYDYDGKAILGDANKESLTKIWTKAEWVRDMHRKRDFPPFCAICNVNRRRDRPL